MGTATKGNCVELSRAEYNTRHEETQKEPHSGQREGHENGRNGVVVGVLVPGARGRGMEKPILTISQTTPPSWVS